MKIIAIVGMAGSGKTETAEIFEKHNFKKIRFGDVTDNEVKRRKLPLNEKNERIVREELRKKYGMEAYAKLSVKKIKEALKHGNVVIDGLYSMEEYMYLKKIFPKLIIIAIYAPPDIRYERLGKRPERPLTKEECISRDISELKNSNKGGPIVMADYTIINDKDIKALGRETERILKCIHIYKSNYGN